MVSVKLPKRTGFRATGSTRFLLGPRKTGDILKNKGKMGAGGDHEEH